ncbi:MAG: hypothetical protein HUU54_05780 [Ignavibacteriaceae bacterium]|nr:hypothetical protein [Ignavibacteriaceae bacterium]
MGTMYLIQIKATPSYNLTSSYNRIVDMGRGITDNLVKLKNKYAAFQTNLTPIDHKLMQLIAIKNTLDAKSSLKHLQRELITDFVFLTDFQKQLKGGINISTNQRSLIDNKFSSIKTKLKEIHLREAMKEQIDTTSRIKMALREINFNKIEFKQVKRSSMTIIRAKKTDSSTVSVQLKPDGSMALDLSNVPKERCRIEMNKILESFKEKGIIIETQKIFNHESQKGSETTMEVEKQFDPFDLAVSFEQTDFTFEAEEEEHSIEQNKTKQHLFNKQIR